jgi:putative YphP/YqiW family bacilliredoxin
MRQELTQLGVKELRTAPEVEQQIKNTPGTTMVVVNSVCGCAAGKARPGVSLALKHPVLPDSVVTVFAGQDLEATAKARSYFTGMPPSSPQVALLKDGKLVFMLHRHDIEGREAKQIADVLTSAFDQHCGAA